MISVHIQSLKDFEHYLSSIWNECNFVVAWIFLTTDLLHFVATAEFSKFVHILSAALSQHQLLGLEIVQLGFHHLHYFAHGDTSKGPLDFTLQDVWLQVSDHTQWLSGWLRSFLHSSSVYYCHLFLISFASVRSLPFLSFTVPILEWNIPLVSLIFLMRYLVFPILLLSSISLHFSLRKAFLSLLAIFWNSAFRWVYLCFSPLPLASLLFSAICKASSDYHFAFLHFPFLGMIFITASCTMLQTFFL